MVTDLYNWLLQIPSFFSKLAEWVVSPIYEPYINISPLALFSIAGLSVLLVIIGLHVVRLFVG